MLLDNLYAQLEPLKLYALRQDSLIDCELAAYGVALELVENLLEDIAAQAFVQTATGAGLALHEKLVGLHGRTGVSTSARRELVLYRLGLAPFDFNLSGMLNSLRAGGMEAEIIENVAGESLKIVCIRMIDDFLDMDSVRASLATMLPAHLEAEFDVGVCTWEMLDASGITWDAWDTPDFTWEEFDLQGHIILLGGSSNAE